MKIISDEKLDFSDVLIRPKRSILYSRSMVSLERTMKFPHSGQTWTGVPIIAANMDTVGTFEMHKALSEHDVITCIAKHYNSNSDNWWKLPYEKNTNTLCYVKCNNKQFRLLNLCY